ncbi:MAG: hypothetical protein K2Y21_00185 [Phycisphaerales bacterium]|nr:hypothetical protein [Phycisphaerales bacterium]
MCYSRGVAACASLVRMDQVVRSVRFAGVASVGGLTLVAGAALVWHYVQPEMLPLLSTWQLGAILGTFVLPMLCFAVWQADRKVSAAAPVRRAPESRAAVIRQPMVSATPLILVTDVARRSIAEVPDRQEVEETLPVKGEGRLGHRPRQPRRSRTGRAPAHRHRRFADV